MKEIIKSKGIIMFFVFILGISIISTNAINSMEENTEVKTNVLVINENI